MKNLFYTISLVVLGGLFCFASIQELYAQEDIVQYKVVNLDRKVHNWQNELFYTLYFTGTEIRTLDDFTLLRDSRTTNFVINPTRASFAKFTKKQKKFTLYSTLEAEKMLRFVKDKRKGRDKKAIALNGCYSTDARRLFVNYSNGQILGFATTKKYPVERFFQGDNVADFMTISSDNYFLATGCNVVKSNLYYVDIWDIEKQKKRTTLPMQKTITGVAFSNDATMLAVATDNEIKVFNTRKWQEICSLDGINHPFYIKFNIDDKYLSYLDKDGKLVIWNVRKQKEEAVISDQDEAIGFSYLLSADNKDFLMINGLRSFSYWDVSSLSPNFGKLINEEVDRKMNEWTKMMQGETLENYHIRVNDKTRAEQQRIFAMEEATKLAKNRVFLENPFSKSYDLARGILVIGFSNMSDIEIAIDKEDAIYFKDPKNMAFSNAKYMINDQDEFELVYLEVTNVATQKMYVYDNVHRMKMSAIKDDSQIVSLEILQQIHEEEIKLNDMKEKIISEKKQEKLITDNTRIDVSTEAIPSVDSEGKNIVNYRIAYQYEVINQDFSGNEDFPSGAYFLRKSNAAMSLMKIIKESFESGDFCKYLREGAQIKIKITGSADAAPIRNAIRYAGEYGDFEEEPYYNNGVLNSISVSSKTGISTNEQLALLRAAGVRDFVENDIPAFRKTKRDYNWSVEVATERGSEYRRINVEFTIIDAFSN